MDRHARANGAGAAVKHKRDGRWQDVSWAELQRRARDVSDGLAALGVRQGDRIAVLGDTNLEWMLADLGILGAGAITATIYQSNQAEECRYIVENAGARLIFCDSAAQVAKIRQVKDRLPTLEGIIRAEGPAADGFERTLADLEKLGQEWRKANPRAHEERLARIGPDDVATLIYTSGTTGNPKGVMLTHGNWTYEAAAVETIKIVLADDILLLFLPMAHSFAKVIQAAWLATGCSCAFVESMDKIMDNASEVRPTVMPAVPRIFEKAYNMVISKGFAAPGLKGKLFRLAMQSFDAYAQAREKGKDYSSFGLLVGRKLVFPKLTAALNERFGGRMRFFVSGGAPLSPKIAWFFDTLGFTILEGYGLSESSAGTFVNRPGQNKIGTVGPPVPGTEVKIAEDGEILIRGPGLMKGYWNNPAATAEVLKDGWLLTGDIGELDGRAPQDHRPQEGHHRHRRREERRAAEPRERSQDRSARLAGDGARRQAEVPLRARDAERGERAQVGERPRRPRGRAAALPPGGDRADPAGDRRAQRPAGELLDDQALRHRPEGLHAGDGRADAHAEGEAQGRHAEVPGGARRLLRRVAQPGGGGAPHEAVATLRGAWLTPPRSRRPAWARDREGRWPRCAYSSSRTTTTTGSSWPRCSPPRGTRCSRPRAARRGSRCCAEHPVDVVITDVGMPGMGGLEMARAAKAIAPRVPVVIVTGWAEREDIANARGREVDAVLIKPVDPDALTQAVSDVAQGRGPA